MHELPWKSDKGVCAHTHLHTGEREKHIHAYLFKLQKKTSEE